LHALQEERVFPCQIRIRRKQTGCLEIRRRANKERKLKERKLAVIIIIASIIGGIASKIQKTAAIVTEIAAVLEK